MSSGAVKNPMVWIDLEMSGLDLKKDYILEVACLITDGDLNVIEEGPNLIIKHPETLLLGMNEWCMNAHKGSGLYNAVIDSSLSMGEAELLLLSFIKKHIPQPKIGILSGNSVHVDKQFLLKDMPLIMEHLHYRIVDVSTVKELARRWYPVEFEQLPCKRLCHRALDDIKESISELAYYRENVFKQIKA